MISRTASGIGSINIKTGLIRPSCKYHPLSGDVGHMTSGCATSAHCHILAWTTALRILNLRASEVGGICSGFELLRIIDCWTKSVFSRLLPDNLHTSFSIRAIELAVKSVILHMPWRIPGFSCKTFTAVTFPMPYMKDTVSHPVMEWHRRRLSQNWGPRCVIKIPKFRWTLLCIVM